jgi:DNA modification methylase
VDLRAHAGNDEVDLGKINWTLKQFRLDELTDYYKNPRSLSEKEFKQLKTSLDKFGMIDKPIVNADSLHTIIGGHQRKHVLEAGGAKEVECWIPDRELSDKEVEELNIRLNKNTGSWDFDVLANEFELDDLLEWGFDKGELDLDLWANEAPEDVEPQIDKAEELRVKWGVETGQLWQLGEHRLICGDCTDKAVVDKVMQGEVAGAVVTDPPYNVAYSSRGSNKDNWGKIENDEMSDEDFYAWLLTVARAIDSAIASGASIYLCHGDTDRKSIPFIDIFRDLDWKRSSTIIWVKQAASMGWQDYRSQHECLSYGWKQGAEHYFTDDRSQTTVWEIKRDAQASYKHPTQKPVELFEKAIGNSTKAQDLVYDPFLGSGTTLIACERLGRKCRAVEISPAYCAVAIQRWVDVTGGVPELVA